MSRHRVVASLPSEEYRHLRAEAAREDRSIEQQASYLLRKLLEDSERTRNQVVSTAGAASASH
jgi:plasmid stability protein